MEAQAQPVAPPLPSGPWRRRQMFQKFVLDLFEREPVGGRRRQGRLDFPRELLHRVLEIRIVARERQRGAILRQRFGQQSCR